MAQDPAFGVVADRLIVVTGIALRIMALYPQPAPGDAPQR
jgi:hypothetical protein